MIKLYRNDIGCGDYHDIMIDEYERKINELHEYGEKINKKILFTASQCMSPIPSDCFVEIVSNVELTHNEKKHLIEVVKCFCGDADIKGKTLDITLKPLTIVFNQLKNIEVVEN